MAEQGEVQFMLEPVVLKYVSRQFVEEVSKEITAIAVQQSLKPLKLLHSHVLVEDHAPDSIRAMQIRLVLKPIKDKLQRAIAANNIDLDAFREMLHESLATTAPPSEVDTMGIEYTETNLALVGLWF
jgi:hypothetical protein